MRVLYVIDHLFPGGAGRSLAAMAPYLVSSGLELEVAYLVDKTGLVPDLERAGVRVVRVAGSSRPRWAAGVTRLVHRRRPDVVHTTLFEADLAGRVAGFVGGVPVACSLVNLAYGPEQLREHRLVRWKVRAARRADALTARTVARFHALSDHVAEVMGQRLRIPGERIDVIPRGRDSSSLGKRTDSRRTAARHRIGAREDDPLILSAARQEYQKGLDVLLDAFPIVRRSLTNARLLICGREGGASSDLRDKAAALGIEVSFLGARDDVPDLMCAADVFVLPSRWEGLGGVVLEAMALEVPIVASDLPAVRDVVDHGACGRLVPPERPNELAEAIVGSFWEKDETHRRVELAKSRFEEHYTVERVAGQMLAFYERVGSSRRLASSSA